MTTLYNRALNTLQDYKNAKQTLQYKGELDQLKNSVESFENNEIKMFRDKMNLPSDLHVYGPMMCTKIKAMLDDFCTFKNELNCIESNDLDDDPVVEVNQMESPPCADKSSATNEGTTNIIVDYEAELTKLRDMYEQDQRVLEKLRNRQESLTAIRKALYTLFDTTKQQMMHHGVQHHFNKGLDMLRVAKLGHECRDRLTMLFDQIKSHPERPDFKIIRLTNHEFMSKIGLCSGAFHILQAAGFDLKPFREIKAELKESFQLHQLKMDLQCHVDEPYLMMSEPDVQKQYQAWVDWTNHLEAIVTRLKALDFQKVPY